MERIRELREEFGITQKKLSEILGVTRTAVAKWEANENGPNSDVLLKIADYFDVSLDYLLGRTDIKKAPVESDKGDRSAMEQEFIELYHRLTPDQKKTVSALISALLDDKEES